MRVLISSTHFSGHLQPLLPYALALQRRGHNVLVSAPEGASQTIKRAGLPYALAGFPSPEEWAAGWVRLDEAKGERVHIIGAQIFVDSLAASAFPTLEATIREWRPDVILRESFEFAAAVAAESADVPHARVSVHSNQHEAGLSGFVFEPLNTLRAAAGLGGDPAAALKEEAIFTSFPASLDGSAESAGWQKPYRFRDPHKAVDAPPTVPVWAPQTGEHFIYITFGTVSGRSEKAKSVYRAALEAVARLPIRALLTTGPVMEVGALGSIPANVTVETYVPQAEVFRFAKAVVCHGGSGTLLGGLAAGLPMVVVPIFADQPLNARNVEASGAGIAVFDVDAQSLRVAIERTLTDPQLASNAGRIAEEMAAMPTMDNAVDALTSLAGKRAA